MMNLSDAPWDEVRVFLAVFQQGSLSGAARTLGLAQPTVRRALEALERTIGAALFARSPAGLTPTEAARDLVTHAEAMAAAAQAFGRAASGTASDDRGRVRITTSDVIGAEVLPGVLTGLRATHPGLIFELHLGNRTEDLLRQDADLAVRMVRPTQANLVAKPVGAIALGLFAHPSLIEARGMPRNLEELCAAGLIGPDRDADALRLIEASGFPVSPADFAIRVDSQLAQLAAIRAGLGIGVCQKALAARPPHLVPVLEREYGWKLDTWIVMHEDLRRVRRIRITFDHLVQAFTAYARSA